MPAHFAWRLLMLQIGVRGSQVRNPEMLYLSALSICLLCYLKNTVIVLVRVKIIGQPAPNRHSKKSCRRQILPHHIIGDLSPRHSSPIKDLSLCLVLSCCPSPFRSCQKVVSWFVLCKVVELFSYIPLIKMHVRHNSFRQQCPAT